MRSILTGAIILLIGAGPAAANELMPNGRYTGTGPGGNVTLKVSAGRGSLELSTGRCAGGMEGKLSRTKKSLTMTADDPTLPCTLTLHPVKGGAYRIEEGRGCSAWHGAGCGFDGATIMRSK